MRNILRRHCIQITKNNKTKSCIFWLKTFTKQISFHFGNTTALKKLIKQKGICFACLKKGHLANACSEKYDKNVTGEITVQYAHFLNQLLTLLIPIANKVHNCQCYY